MQSNNDLPKPMTPEEVSEKLAAYRKDKDMIVIESDGPDDPAIVCKKFT